MRVMMLFGSENMFNNTELPSDIKRKEFTKVILFRDQRIIGGSNYFCHYTMVVSAWESEVKEAGKGEQESYASPASLSNQRCGTILFNLLDIFN